MSSEDLEELERAAMAAGLAKEFDQMLNEMTLLRKNLFQMQEAAKSLALELEDQRSVMACLEGIGDWLHKRRDKCRNAKPSQGA